MSEQDNTAPAVWDPTARDGAGGWVRRAEPRTTPLRKTDEPQGAAPGEPGAAPRDGSPEERTAVLPPVPAGPFGPPAGPIPAQTGPEPVPTELDQPVVRPFAAAAGAPTAQPTPTVPNFAGPPGPAGTPPPPAAPPVPTTAPMPGYGPAGGSPYAPPGAGYTPTAYGSAAGAAPTAAGYPPPYQPGGPAYPPPTAPASAPVLGGPPTRSNLPMLVAVVVVVAALLGVGAVWGLGLGRSPSTSSTGAAGAPSASTGTGATTGPTSSAAPSPSDSPSASPSDTSSAAATSQANAVDTVLAQSASDRKQVASAAGDAGSCTNLGAAQSAFQTAASDRQSLAAKIGQLDVSLLPNGAAMMQSLARAEQESASADTSFAAWAGALISSGCTSPGPAPTNGSDYQAAIAASQQASTDKQNFVAQWNAIAGQYQLHQWTKDDI